MNLLMTDRQKYIRRLLVSPFPPFLPTVPRPSFVGRLLLVAETRGYL